MSKEDYYQTLGVDKSASSDDIKKAYRRLAMKYHPDRNQSNKDAEVKFKKINEAYSILSDEQKRANFDQFGHAGVDPNMGGGAGAAGFGDIFGGFSDIFEDLFSGGGGRQQTRQQKGSDLGYQMNLTLEEAIQGCEQQINVPILSHCEHCDGTGAKPGSSPITCSTCNGNGQVRLQQGFIAIQQTCPQCRGAGKIIKDRCIQCNGNGRSKKRTSLSVKIPAGVSEGDKIRLSGKGEAGPNGGPSGDLFIQINVKPHKIFTREEDDLYCEVPISFIDAALGNQIEVPTIKGKVTIKIPAETQTGALFRLRDKGVKSARTQHTGDLLCRVLVETPIRLTQEQKQLLQQLDTQLKQGGNKHSPKANSWFQNIKKFIQDLGQ